MILYRVKNVLSTELAKHFIIHEVIHKETSKRTPDNYFIVSSLYKTPKLLSEMWTSLHEANILMNLITFQLHEWSMHKSPDPICYAMGSGCARLRMEEPVAL